MNRRDVLQIGAAGAGVIALPLGSAVAPSQAAAIPMEAPVLHPILQQAHGMIMSVVDAIELGCRNSLPSKAAQLQYTMTAASSMVESAAIPVSASSTTVLTAIQRRTALCIQTLESKALPHHKDSIKQMLTTVRREEKKIRLSSRRQLSTAERRMELLRIMGIDHVGWVG